MRCCFLIDNQIIKEKQMTAKKIENSISFQNIIWDSPSLARNPRASIWYTRIDRRNHQRCTIKTSVLKTFAKFTGKHLCQSLFLKKRLLLKNFIKKETLAQVFFREFWEILKNTIFTERFRTTASESICDLPLK